MADEAAAGAQTEQDDGPRATGIEPLEDPLTVLVVDDDHVVARLMGDGLVAMGQKVEIAHSASEARRILQSRDDIGVVVSDIRMPGGDGLDLALDIASLTEESRAASVVLITGHATLEDAAKAVRTGAADFLRKPCRLSELAGAVERGIAKARLRRGAAQRQAVVDQRIADLEAERMRLLGRVQEASRRLAALPANDYLPRLERDIMAVSHALRTPLNAIAGGATLLEWRSLNGTTAAADITMLRHGVAQAVAAVELVEELHRPHHLAQGEAAGERFSMSRGAGRAVARMRAAAQEAGIGLIGPDSPGPLVTAPVHRFDRVVDLCIGAALENAARGSVIAISCGAGQSEGAPWAWMTLLCAPFGAAEGPGLPATPDLPVIGTLLSRTQETLRFSVARRIAEGMGGRLTSCRWVGGAFAMRLALPG